MNVQHFRSLLDFSPRELDALIDRKDRDVTGPAQSSVVVDRLDVPQHLGVSVRADPDPLDEIGAGKMKKVLGDLGLVVEETVGFGAEEIGDGGHVVVRFVLDSWWARFHPSTGLIIGNPGETDVEFESDHALR